MASAPDPLNALGTLTGAAGEPPRPLAVAPPSPMLLLYYPLFAANVRILCDQDSWRSRGQSSWATVISSMRGAYRQEGVIGLYRGGHLYLLHQLFRDGLRCLAERGIQLAERGLKPLRNRDAEGEEDTKEEQAATTAAASASAPYRRRVLAKYLIEAISYPLLLASTRSVILHGDPRSSWEHICCWRREEGLLSLFGGVTASLLSTALDEAMENVIAACIEYCAMGSEVDMADRILLKFSGSSVVSIFFTPLSYVGIIQRCQSRVDGMLKPEPLRDLVCSLPWRSTLYQFLFWSGIMAVNVQLIQWKIRLQNDEEVD